MKRNVFSIISGLIVALGVFYFTWCWGMWGRDNLYMKYVFQCACPRVSEQARYKPFKVIAPACSNPHLLDISPNGKYALVDDETNKPRLIHLNLESGEISVVGFSKSIAFFLTDNLLIIATIEDARYFLVDISNGVKTEIYLESDIDKAISKARNMEQIWWQSGLLIGIKDDYQNNPENSVLFMTPGNTYSEQRDLLISQGIEYEAEPFSYMPENGLYADFDGIYLGDKLIVETGQISDETLNTFGPTTWALGGNAVIYEPLNHLFPLFGKPTKILQPVLLLEVPSQYQHINITTP